MGDLQSLLLHRDGDYKAGVDLPFSPPTEGLDRFIEVRSMHWAAIMFDCFDTNLDVSG